MRRDLPIAPVTTVAAFALGAALTWLVWRALETHRGPGPVSDDILRANVRARVGALVSRPDAVVVEVRDGEVRLSGNVQPEERVALLQSIVDIPGVQRLRSALSTLRRVA